MNAVGSQPAAIRVGGLGLVTPLGEDLETSWQRIINGAAITDHARAPVPCAAGMDRVTCLGLTAAREAVARSGWSGTHLSSSRTGLVVGTSKGPADDWIESWRGRPAGAGQTGGWAERSSHDAAAPPLTSDKPLAGVEVASELLESVPFGLHTVASTVARGIGVGVGPVLTVSCACATGIAALIRGVMMLRDGSADRVMVVATESSLHPLFIGSFRRLGVLAGDGEPVRPLDRRRNGFLISEAAAAVCLERCQPRSGDVLIDRFAMGADATHLTGIDPQGQTIRSCLDRVAAGKPADLVHAHATGTQLNDPIELAAVDDCVGRPGDDDGPIVYSHKAAIGHSLGAAGLVSVVLNVLAHQRNQIPGNVHTTAALATTNVHIPNRAVQRPVKRSIASAAGFGGAAAVIAFKTA